MPFSPREIENREFVVSFRGYDRDEVRAFLRAAAADYEAALDAVRRRDGSEVEVPKLSRAGSAPEGSGEIVPASRTERGATVIRGDAERDAGVIVEDAERRAAGIRRAAESFAEQRLAEVGRRTGELRALEERIGRRLYFLETALELARRDLGVESSTFSINDDHQGEFPVSARQYFPKAD